MRVEQRLQPRNQVKSKLQIVLSPGDDWGQARLGVMGRRQVKLDWLLPQDPRLGLGQRDPREEISILKIGAAGHLVSGRDSRGRRQNRVPEDGWGHGADGEGHPL